MVSRTPEAAQISHFDLSRRARSIPSRFRALCRCWCFISPLAVIGSPKSVHKCSWRRFVTLYHESFGHGGTEEKLFSLLRISVPPGQFFFTANVTHRGKCRQCDIVLRPCQWTISAFNRVATGNILPTVVMAAEAVQLKIYQREWFFFNYDNFPEWLRYPSGATGQRESISSTLWETISGYRWSQSHVIQGRLSGIVTFQTFSTVLQILKTISDYHKAWTFYWPSCPSRHEINVNVQYISDFKKI